MSNEAEGHGTDHELLAAARAGDRAALERLLERHQAQVYRFGMKMCRDPEDAKEVLQETLFAMARGVRDFRGASSISTWLYSIARGFCIKKRRKRKHGPAEERSLETDLGGEAALLADGARSADDVIAGKEIEQALERALDALEPMYREVLVLRDVEGLTAPEAAEVLGISAQAVKSRLHRARLSVRAHVAPLLGVTAEATAAPGTCPDVLTLFSRHLEGEIDARSCAEMERHLEACPRCKGACDSLKRTLALCRAAGPATEVPQEVRATVRAALAGLLDATR
jgi:RNA polymerase sigma-70 factor (ECF subfamily)